MKDYLSRKIKEEAYATDEKGNSFKATAWRTENSTGEGEIGIGFGHQKMIFDLDDHELHARLVISLLEKICSSPCDLPVLPESKFEADHDKPI